MRVNLLVCKSEQTLPQLYQELLTKHMQQISDMDLQQDNRAAEAICDLSKVRNEMLNSLFVHMHVYLCVWTIRT